MVSRRVRRSWYSFGIFVKSMGSTLSLNCATSTSPDFSQGKYPLHPSSLAALAASWGDLAGLLDPADGFRARTAPTDTGEARHRVDRFFERRLATRDLALQIGPMLHVDRRAVRLRQIREDVSDVLLDIGERPAVRPHHLVREFATSAEEAPVRQPQ